MQKIKNQEGGQHFFTPLYVWRLLLTFYKDAAPPFPHYFLERKEN